MKRPIQLLPVSNSSAKLVDMERLKKEILAVGLPNYSAIRKGIPVIEGLTADQEAVFAGVLNSHVAKDTDYISIDFEKNENTLRIKALVSEAQWKNYCDIQIAFIRSKREEDYKKETDSLFFDYQSGGITKEEWLAKREEVAKRYPYPGDYR
jgi:hypothetical protein